MRRGLILMVVLVLFLGVFLFVAIRRTPPEIPGDGLHMGLQGRPDDCMTCHGPEGASPRGPNHPFGKHCWSCHYVQGEVR